MAATGVDRIKRMMTNWGFTAEEEVVFLSGNVDEIVSRYSSHLLFIYYDLFNDLLITFMEVKLYFTGLVGFTRPISCIFVTSIVYAVFILQKWFLHQNGIAFNQKF